MKNETLVHLGGRKWVCPSTIIMLKADTNYTLIYLADGKVFFTATTLGILEERLKSYNFYRTHRSTLINLGHLIDIKRNIESNSFEGVKMGNNINIPIARRKMTDFLRLLQNY
jgi:DNA-binding LytR/AlgR family response regulator